MTENKGTSDKPPSHTLEGIVDFRKALVELLQQSRRSVCILSESLPRPLYHDKQVRDAVSLFARSNHLACVRILIRDSGPIVQQFHRLHILSQRLSSRIEIRKLEATADTANWEFLVADGKHLMVMDDKQKWLGRYEMENPVRARQLLDIFEQSWPLASVDRNLRRLQL